MDLERAMQFILNAQAQQAVTLQAHAEILERHAAALRSLDERLVTVTDLVGRLAQTELCLAADLRAADERSKAADERLNALITIVNQMIRRNGKN